MPKRHTPELRLCLCCNKRKPIKYFYKMEGKPTRRRACKQCVDNDCLYDKGKFRQECIRRTGHPHVPSFVYRSIEDLEVKTVLYAVNQGLQFSTEDQWKVFLKMVKERSMLK